MNFLLILILWFCLFFKLFNAIENQNLTKLFTKSPKKQLKNNAFEKIGYLEELSSSNKGWSQTGLKSEQPPNLNFLNWNNSSTFLKTINTKINELSILISVYKHFF